jgi:hypothetical protein
MSSPVSDDILRAGSGAGRVRPPTIRIRSPRDSQWTGETTLPEAGVVSPARYIYTGAMGQSDVPPRLIVTLGAVLFAGVMVGSVFAGISSSPIPFASLAASTATFAAPNAAAPSAPSVIPFGTNVGLVGTVAADQQAFAASGRNPALLHPPNLHQAPPLRSTGGVVTSLYSVGPAPMGVAYDGLKNTTGTMQATTVNTTSLAGTYSTGDPMGTQTEEFDVPTGPNAYQPSYDSYGAQLNAVLANVTIFGHTSFYNPKDPDAPHGCPDCAGNPSRGPAPCPNEFWISRALTNSSSVTRSGTSRTPRPVGATRPPTPPPMTSRWSASVRSPTGSTSSPTPRARTVRPSTSPIRPRSCCTSTSLAAPVTWTPSRGPAFRAARPTAAP